MSATRGLLGLALVFPDEAPSRFRLALAAGTVESLQARLRSAREVGDELDAQEAAEILLQLVAALDVHDRITRGHAERVRGYAASLGRQIGLADQGSSTGSTGRRCCTTSGSSRSTPGS